ncbi:expressed protein, partial [Aureococcus anophagefferens]
TLLAFIPRPAYRNHERRRLLREEDEDQRGQARGLAPGAGHRRPRADPRHRPGERQAPRGDGQGRGVDHDDLPAHRQVPLAQGRGHDVRRALRHVLLLAPGQGRQRGPEQHRPRHRREVRGLPPGLLRREPVRGLGRPREKKQKKNAARAFPSPLARKKLHG